MEKIIKIIEYIFQFQREYFFSLLQLGIFLIVFGVFYFLRKKFLDFKIPKIINLKARKWKIFSFLILLAAVSLGFLFAIKMPILGDEAVLTIPSYAVGQGLIMYKDFASHSVPLLFYVYGLFFKITGVSILAAQVLSFIFFLLGLYVIYKIFASYFKKAYLPLAIFLFLVLLHPSDFSQFFYIGTKRSIRFFYHPSFFIFLEKQCAQNHIFVGGFCRAGRAYQTHFFSSAACLSLSYFNN